MKRMNYTTATCSYQQIMHCAQDLGNPNLGNKCGQFQRPNLTLSIT